MAADSLIRHGEVYWLDDCPPLEGRASKRRPVIVTDDQASLKRGGPVLVVAVSTTALPTETDRIKLPNKQENPNTTSGLTKPCWAVPRWLVVVERDRLRERAGFISGQTLDRIRAAVKRRIQQRDSL